MTKGSKRNDKNPIYRQTGRVWALRRQLSTPERQFQAKTSSLEVIGAQALNQERSGANSFLASCKHRSNWRSGAHPPAPRRLSSPEKGFLASETPFSILFKFPINSKLIGLLPSSVPDLKLNQQAKENSRSSKSLLAQEILQLTQ